MTQEQLEEVENNLGLVYSSVNKNHYGNEDYVSIGTIGLINAVKTYDPTKNIQKSTYYYKCINNEIYDTYTKNNIKTIDTMSLNAPINNSNVYNLTVEDSVVEIGGSPEEILIEKETNDELEHCVKCLSIEERVIICHYFGLLGYYKCSLKEIADMLGMKYQKVFNIKSDALKRLKRMLKKCSF